MNAICNKTANPSAGSFLFTLNEAAWVAEAKDAFINQEVDKKVVVIVPGTRRLFAHWDVLYLRAVREIAPSMRLDLRKRIYLSVREELESGRCHRVKLDAFEVRVPALIGELDPRVAKIAAARDAVEARPNIKGGEPVVRGTRIPVHTLAKIVQSGASLEAVADEYDLSPVQVELSLLYDRLHPRRGRPLDSGSDSGLSDLGPHLRADIQYLGNLNRRGTSRTG